MATDPNIKITIASAYDPTGTNQAQAALRQTQAAASGIGNETITDMADQMNQVSQATSEAAESTKELGETVQQTGDDYEALQKRVAELEDQIKKTSETHVTHRKKAEQSAGGIIGAYNNVKKAVVGVKNVISKIGWWMAVANQAWELMGKLADYFTTKARQAKEQAEAQIVAQDALYRKVKELERAVKDEAAARKQAAQEAEKAKINSMYEERLSLIRQAMETEELLAEIQAKKAGNEYAVTQARLLRDLALGKIDQAAYDEKMRDAEVAHNETIRKQKETQAENEIKTVQEQVKINRAKYDEEIEQLRKLKEAKGTEYHDFSIMGQKFSVGVDAWPSKILTPEQYKVIAGTPDTDETGKRTTPGEVDILSKRLWDLTYAATKEEELDNAWKFLFDDSYREEIANIQRELKTKLQIIKDHTDGLISLGLIDENTYDGIDLTRATADFDQKYKGLTGTGKEPGSVATAQNELKTSTKSLTSAQDKLRIIIEGNKEERKAEGEVTTSQRQIREDKAARDAIVKNAQNQVDHLQGKQDMQRQDAAANQTGIDRLLQGSTDDKFRTLLDRYDAAIAQRPDDKYRAAMQEAFEKFKGYVTSSPEQLAGKQEELTKVLQKIALGFSELGTKDLHSYDTLVGMLQDKMTKSGQIADTAKQQQSAANDLSNLKLSTAITPDGTPADKQRRDALQNLAIEAVGSKQGKTSEQEKQALDTIAGLLADGKLLADERTMFSDAIAKLAETDQATANYIRERLNKAEQTTAETKQEMEQPAQGGSEAAILQRNLAADRDGATRAAQYRSELETIANNSQAGSQAATAVADTIGALADNVMDPAELARTAANAERLLQSTSEADRAAGACLRRIVEAYGAIIQQQQAKTAEMNGLYQTVNSLTTKFLNASMSK